MIEAMEHTEPKKEQDGHVVVEENVVVVEGAAAPAGGGPKRDRFLALSILIAGVLVGGAIVFAALYHPGAAVPDAGGGMAAAPSVVDAAKNLGPRDAILGNANAPVTLVEYGDYQCPFCTRYFQTIQPLIVTNYVNTGKVKMVFRDFPFLGPESLTAANAAECAVDQGKLWPYHDALYQAKLDDEMKGGSENDGVFNRALFLKLAQNVGLDMATFTSCLDGNKDASIVAQNKAAAAAAGVNSTPTTFVNGKMVVDANGNSAGADPNAVTAAIEAALKG